MTAINASSAGLASFPGASLRAVTPTDGSDLPSGVCRALYVGGSGNVAVIAEDDSVAVTLSGVGAGQVLPIRAKRVLSTNTTATSIVAIY